MARVVDTDRRAVHDPGQRVDDVAEEGVARGPRDDVVEPLVGVEERVLVLDLLAHLDDRALEVGESDVVHPFGGEAADHRLHRGADLDDVAERRGLQLHEQHEVAGEVGRVRVHEHRTAPWSGLEGDHSLELQQPQRFSQGAAAGLVLLEHRPLGPSRSPGFRPSRSASWTMRWATRRAALGGRVEVPLMVIDVRPSSNSSFMPKINMIMGDVNLATWRGRFRWTIHSVTRRPSRRWPAWCVSGVASGSGRSSRARGRRGVPARALRGDGRARVLRLRASTSRSAAPTWVSPPWRPWPSSWPGSTRRCRRR